MAHTLLLADDSVTIQRVIELTFADEDVKVVAVSDGDQAIERLESTPPDIVLADIGMPGKNGYEVARYIKQSPKLSHIPVVLLTGAFEPVDQARASEAGCDGVLAKPFEPQLVIGRVKELLAKSRPVAASLDDKLTPPAAAEDRSSPPLGDDALASTPSSGSHGAELDDYFDRLDAAFADLTSGPAAGAAPPASKTPPPAPEPAAETPAAAESSSSAADDFDWLQGDSESAKPNTEPWDFPAPESPDVFEMSGDLPPAGESPTPAPDAAAAPADVEHVDFEAISVFEPPAFVHPELPSAETTAETPAPETITPPVAAAPPPSLAAPSSSPVTLPAPPIAQPSQPSAARAPRPVAPSVQSRTLPPLADAFAALLAAEQGEPVPQAAPLWPASPAPTAAADDELVERVVRQVLDRLSDRVVRETVGETVSQVAERLVREEIERIKASIK